MLDKFKNYLILNNIKPNNYISRMKLFLKKNSIITQDIIENYVVKQSETKSAETINMDIKALKQYCKFLKININFPKLKKPKYKIPETITLEYFEKEIIPVIEYVSQKSYRAVALLYFMLYTGIRKSEVINIKRIDINLEERNVKIQNIKSNKEEIKPFSKKIIPFLKLYFNKTPEITNAFNINLNGINHIFNVLKEYTKKPIHPHILRRSIATHLYERGASVELIRDFLGHENIETTVKYLGKNRKMIHNLYDKYIK